MAGFSPCFPWQVAQERLYIFSALTKSASAESADVANKKFKTGKKVESK
jgi:hypothetical protein